MQLRVQRSTEGHRLVGAGADVELANRFLAHLGTRNFSAATRRAYAYDLLNFLRFLAGRGVELVGVCPTDLFDYLDWQQQPRRCTPGAAVVRLADRRGAAAATMNRRIAAVRGLFEFAVITGARSDSPVPSPRRSSGLRAPRGCWVTCPPGTPAPVAGWCARRGRCRRVCRWSRWRRSCPTWPRIGIGRWCWRCCWVGCARLRCVTFFCPMWTWVGVSCGCGARGAGSGWCRWTGRSSPSWPVICGRNARRAA